MQRLSEINLHFLLHFPSWDGISLPLLVAMVASSCQWKKPVGSKNKWRQKPVWTKTGRNREVRFTTWIPGSFQNSSYPRISWSCGLSLATCCTESLDKQTHPSKMPFVCLSNDSWHYTKHCKKEKTAMNPVFENWKHKICSWEYQTTLPASCDTCIQVKKQQLEPDMEQQTGSKLGKEYVKSVYCDPVYLTYMQSTSYSMPRWDGAQAGIKISRRNINNFREADEWLNWTELMSVKQWFEVVAQKDSF